MIDSLSTLPPKGLSEGKDQPRIRVHNFRRAHTHILDCILIFLHMLMSTLPKKGLKIANVSICSLRNKVQDIDNLLTTDKIGQKKDRWWWLTTDKIGQRKDRDIFGGGVAMYIQSHIPVKLRRYLMSCDVEMLWLRVHLPHLKPILLECCYRPPCSGSQYLDILCEMFERACDENRNLCTGRPKHIFSCIKLSSENEYS